MKFEVMELSTKLMIEECQNIVLRLYNFSILNFQFFNLASTDHMFY